MGLPATIALFLVSLIAPSCLYCMFAVLLGTHAPLHPLTGPLVYDPILSLQGICSHCPALLGDLMYRVPRVFTPSPVQHQPVPKLLRWLEANSGSTGLVEIASFDGLRGLRAVKQVNEGAPALRVPFTCTVNAATFSASDSILAATESWSLEEDASIFLTPLAFLYEALVQREKSAWAAYIATVPLEYTLPINMLSPRSKKLLAALPYINQMTKEWRWLLVRFFPKMIEALRKLPSGEQAIQGMSDQQLWDAYIWAYCASKTRSVTVLVHELSEEYQSVLPTWVHDMGVMVPFLDMANHGSGAQANAMFWNSVAGGTTAGDSSSSQDSHQGIAYMEIVASRDIAPGEQILPMYGGLMEDMDMLEQQHAQCNANWLLEYGFLIDGNSQERHCFAAQMKPWTLTMSGCMSCLPFWSATRSPPTLHFDGASGQSGEDLVNWALDSLVSSSMSLLGGRQLARGVQCSRGMSPSGDSRTTTLFTGDFASNLICKQLPACVHDLLGSWLRRSHAALNMGERTEGRERSCVGGGCGSEGLGGDVEIEEDAVKAGERMLEDVVKGAIVAIEKAQQYLHSRDVHNLLDELIIGSIH